MSQLKYLWHHKVHEKYGETLLYILLSFFPTYKREKIIKQIHVFLEKRGIKSFCLYEIYGNYDVLLRLWLHPKEIPHIFCRALHDYLDSLQCRTALPFYVGENPLHWMWADSSPAELDIANLKENIITMVDRGNADANVINRLTNNKLLIKYEPESGIKFFIQIPPPRTPPPDIKDATEGVVDGIKKVLLDLLLQKLIIEPSIYTGEGFAWVFIKGKVAFENYNALGTLIQRINELGLSHAHGVRTFTHLVTNPGAHVEREGIAGFPKLPEQEERMEEYLGFEEDEQFEVKGSLFMNIDKYIHDKRGSSDYMKDKNYARDGVVKAIVGMLNRYGGKILIGAIEEIRYKNQKKEGFFDNLPKVGTRLVCGIDEEVDFKSKGFDGFNRALTDLVSHHVGVDAASMITCKQYKYEGRTVCMVTVEQGPKWYYIDKREFWVRVSNSTRLLEGDEMDNYKSLYRRG